MKMEKFKTVCKEGLKKLFTQFNDNLGLYTTVFVTVTYHLIAEKDFACSCKPQNQQNWACWLHLFLPVVLLWVLLILRDKCLYWTVAKVVSSLKYEGDDDDDDDDWNQCLIWKFKCGCNGCILKCGESICCESTCCVELFLNGLYALSVSSIWMASVFLDGDWWLCCLNDGSEIQAQVACKPRDALTVEENSIAADLKSESRIIGLVVLLIAAFVPFVRQCCKRRNHELAEVILEEGKDLVFKLEHRAAMKKVETRVQTYLDQEQWEKCSEAVEQLITEMQKNQTRDEEVRAPLISPQSQKASTST